jgi:outer membrane protein OmpA-like peptidoglycan-associated protein
MMQGKRPIVTRLTVLVFGMLLMAGSAFGQAAKTLIINHFVSDPSEIEGHLVVTDVAGKGGSVTVSCYNEAGVLAGKGTEAIPPGGKINVNPDKYVKGKKMIGTIRVTGKQPMVGQYWQFYNTPALGWKNIAVPAAAAPGSTRLICQHFVADSDVESYLVVADADGKAKTVYVEFYSDEGELASQKSFNIPANGKISIQPYMLVGSKKMTGVAYIQTDGGTVTGEYWQVEPNKKYQVAHAMQSGAPSAENLLNINPIRVMVNFAFNSDKVEKRDCAALSEVAKAMNHAKNKTAKFEIGGYTDDKGKEDYNIKLSERRAASVKNYLVKTGKVNAKRLVIVGYGPANPILPNNSEANCARNRRVEFKKLP